ncbi:MAG: 4Fe-4S dicluster domain-containing protein [Candidatus Bathyarchaeota archaeon]|nr:4Fe-4S dicluster domain-containing protein [Candidatus Bathyarchaeota archaeon]
MKAVIDASKCICCKKCHVAKACPIKAVFRISSDEVAFIDMHLCHGCGLCATACPAGAVVMRES